MYLSTLSSKKPLIVNLFSSEADTRNLSCGSCGYFGGQLSTALRNQGRIADDYMHLVNSLRMRSFRRSTKKIHAGFSVGLKQEILY